MGTQIIEQVFDSFIVIGLMYDIVGVLLIAFAITSTGKRSLLLESATFYGGNQAIFESLLVQQADARFGIGMATAGFSMQIFGTLKPGLAGATGLIFVGFIPVLIGSWYGYRKILRARAQTLYKRENDAWRNESESKNEDVADEADVGTF